MFLSDSDFVTLDFPRIAIAATRGCVSFALRARGVIAQDNRRVSNGKLVNRLAGLALKTKPSVDFGGYWQQHVEAAN
jgi:hypothetical protein